MPGILHILHGSNTIKIAQWRHFIKSKRLLRQMSGIMLPFLLVHKTMMLIKQRTTTFGRIVKPNSTIDIFDHGMSRRTGMGKGVKYTSQPRVRQWLVLARNIGLRKRYTATNVQRATSLILPWVQL